MIFTVYCVQSVHDKEVSKKQTLQILRNVGFCLSNITKEYKYICTDFTCNIKKIKTRHKVSLISFYNYTVDAIAVRRFDCIF